MPLIKSKALILRTFDYSETSQIVWFFTRTHGRLHAIAKGSRRARSAFEGALEPFVLLNIEVYRKDKRDLDILGEIELLDIRLPMRASFDRLVWSSFLVELLCSSIQPDDPNPEFFDLTCAVIDHMTHGPINDLPGMVIAFEGRFLKALGFYPSLDRCVDCGDFVSVSRVPFDAQRGGVLCKNHGEGAKLVNRGVLLSFQQLVDGIGPARVSLKLSTQRQLRALLNNYWRHTLETELKLGQTVLQHLKTC